MGGNVGVTVVDELLGGVLGSQYAEVFNTYNLQGVGKSVATADDEEVESFVAGEVDLLESCGIDEGGDVQLDELVVAEVHFLEGGLAGAEAVGAEQVVGDIGLDKLAVAAECHAGELVVAHVDFGELGCSAQGQGCDLVVGEVAVFK